MGPDNPAPAQDPAAPDGDGGVSTPPSTPPAEPPTSDPLPGGDTPAPGGEEQPAPGGETPPAAV